MDPATRNLVRIDVDQAVICDDDPRRCSWATTSEARRNLIQQNAKDVRFLDI